MLLYFCCFGLRRVGFTQFSIFGRSCAGSFIFIQLFVPTFFDRCSKHVYLGLSPALIFSTIGCRKSPRLTTIYTSNLSLFVHLFFVTSYFGFFCIPHLFFKYRLLHVSHLYEAISHRNASIVECMSLVSRCAVSLLMLSCFCIAFLL